MKRVYNVEDNYFENIDTEEKAYWLGFLMADGYINTRQGQDRLILDLALKDRKHLEVYVKTLKFTGPVKDFVMKSGPYKGYSHSIVSITSQKIVNDLSKLGCTPRKSLTLHFPTIISSLIPHFIRGYFDGDGSVFISQEKHWRKGNIYPVIHFRFVGTKEFLLEIDKYINLKGRITQPKGNKAYELSYKRNKKAKEFYDYLYKDATIFLERKKSIFNLHLQE